MPSESTMTTMLASIESAIDTALAVAAPNDLDKINARERIKRLVEAKLDGTRK